MPDLKRLQFETTIAAPPETVWRHILDDKSYRHWTSAFCAGSYFEGTWQQGTRIRFLGPDGSGMVAEIAEHRPAQFLSIRHLGSVQGGIDDTDSEAAGAFTGALENYSLHPVAGGTRLVIDQDMAAEYAGFMQETWPKALALLKGLCEAAPPPR